MNEPPKWEFGVTSEKGIIEHNYGVMTYWSAPKVVGRFGHTNVYPTRSG